MAVQGALTNSGWVVLPEPGFFTFGPHTLFNKVLDREPRPCPAKMGQ